MNDFLMTDNFRHYILKAKAKPFDAITHLSPLCFNRILQYAKPFNLNENFIPIL